jgi:hypothetical protein
MRLDYTQNCDSGYCRIRCCAARTQRINCSKRRERV